ncbi:hypothetical protein VIGAN_07010200, partial [Vigna angularis var. angularis]
PQNLISLHSFFFLLSSSFFDFFYICFLLSSIRFPFVPASCASIQLCLRFMKRSVKWSVVRSWFPLFRSR